MSDVPPPNSQPAGWFPDPEGSGKLRWWDGAKWTDNLQDPPPAPEPQATPSAAAVAASRAATEAPERPTAAADTASNGLGDAAVKKPWYRRAWVMVTASVLALLIVVAALAPNKKGNSHTAQPTDSAASVTKKQAEVTVTRPADGATIHRARFTLAGTATPGTSVVVVNNTEAKAAADGTWTARVDAAVGSNTYTVTASGASYQNTATASVSVIRAMTAHQRAVLRAARAKARAKAKAEAAARAAKAKAEAAARAQRAAAAKAARETNYKASAKSIPYAQLNKNSDPFVGDRAVFRGQILQIQEGSGGGVILLSVTNDGYGYWTDNVWVDYDHPTKSVENDIITVWGTITGQKSYDTQAGGNTYVPRMHARYIAAG